MDFLKFWLSRSIEQRLFDIGILVFILGISIYSIIRFLFFLKQSGVSVKLGRNLGIEFKNESDLKNWINERFSKLENQITQKEENKIPIYQHNIFLSLKHLEERGIDIEKFRLDSSESKDIIEIKLYLTRIFFQSIYAPIFSENLKIFVYNFLKLEDSSGRMDFIFTIPDVIYTIFSLIYDKARNFKIFLPNDIVLPGFPSIYLEKFNYWNSSHIDMIIGKIQEILQSNFYKTVEFKLILILDIIDVVIRLSLDDAHKTIAFMNGELNKEIEKILVSSHKR